MPVSTGDEYEGDLIHITVDMKQESVRQEVKMGYTFQCS